MNQNSKRDFSDGACNSFQALAVFAAILVIMFVTYLQLLTWAAQRFSTHAAAGHATGGRPQQTVSADGAACDILISDLLTGIGGRTRPHPPVCYYCFSSPSSEARFCFSGSGFIADNPHCVGLSPYNGPGGAGNPPTF